jgi:hypothetical protein
LIESEKVRIKTPQQYESLKHVFSQSNASTYDGLRVVVQKQVNLETVASHL